MKISAVKTDTDFTLVLSEDGDSRSASLSVAAAAEMSVDEALKYFCELLGCPCTCNVGDGLELIGDEDDEDLSLYEVVFDPDTMLTEVVEPKTEQ